MKVNTNEYAVVIRGLNSTYTTVANLRNWSCLDAYHKLETDEKQKRWDLTKKLKARHRFLNC